MGLMDNFKAKLGPAKEKVSDLAQQHGGKIEQGLDKAAKAVDERTKGKYSDRIQAGTGKAKGAVDRLAQKDGPSADGGTGAGTGTTAGSGHGGAPTPRDMPTKPTPPAPPVPPAPPAS